jgi:hypothetical protein
MPTPKAPAKSSLPKNVKTAPPLNKEKFNKVFKTIRDARIALNSLNVPRHIASAGPTRQELDSMAKKLGLDPKILKQESALKNEEMLRLAKRQKESAVAKSASVQKVLNGLMPVPTVATQGGPVEHFLINTPFEILTTPGLREYAYEIHDGAGDSFAKFQLEKYSGTATETLSFIFIWYGPSLYTYISVEAFLIMNGYAKAVALGSYGFDIGYTSLGIAPTLAIYDGSANPFNFSIPDQESSVELAAEPVNLGIYQHSVAVSTNVATVADIRVGPFGVPPNSTIVMEVTVDVGYSVEQDNGGSIDADFSSNAYNIAAPGVIVTQWK